MRSSLSWSPSTPERPQHQTASARPRARPGARHATFPRAPGDACSASLTPFIFLRPAKYTSHDPRPPRGYSCAGARTGRRSRVDALLARPVRGRAALVQVLAAVLSGVRARRGALVQHHPVHRLVRVGQGRELAVGPATTGPSHRLRAGRADWLSRRRRRRLSARGAAGRRSHHGRGLLPQRPRGSLRVEPHRSGVRMPHIVMQDPAGHSSGIKGRGGAAGSGAAQHIDPAHCNAKSRDCHGPTSLPRFGVRARSHPRARRHGQQQRARVRLRRTHPPRRWRRGHGTCSARMEGGCAQPARGWMDGARCDGVE